VKNYFGDIENVNDNYLRQCFYWAFREGLKYPVYQIHYNESTENIKEENFVLMVTANENHNNLDHFYDDPRIVSIIKNYPHMINHNSSVGQVYEAKLDDRGVIRFITEKEDERTLNIPLGTCNDFVPYNFTKRENLGGFIGQWTQFREDYVKKLDSFYDKMPFKFAFYNGFGPFIQDKDKGSLNSMDYSYHLSNFEISFCFSGQSPETYRLAESAYAGCVIVSDILPDVWYFRNLPAIFIARKKNFEDIITSILVNKSKRSYYQKAISEWCVETISPPAIGRKIAQHVRGLSENSV
jgi:hypothetical protein